MSTSAIEAVFGPAPANTDLTEDSRVGNNAAVIILWIIAAVAVVLRMISRRMLQAGLRWDDFVIVIALIFCASTAGMTIAGGVYGASTHVWSTTIPNVSMVFKLLYSYTFLYAAAVSTTKLSIILLYHRIFKRNAGRFFDISIGFGVVLTLSYPIVVWATMASACKPLHYFWDRFSGATGTCIDTATFFLALGIINLLNDIVVLAIPIPHIWTLQMSRQRRLAVIGILLLGGFVCVASIVRIHYLTIFMSAVDVTYVMGPVFIWSSVEPCVGILGACISTFSPLFARFRQKATSDNSKYGQDRSGGSHQQRLAGGSALSWKHRKMDDSQRARTDEDEYHLTTYVVADGGVGETGSERSFQNGIMVRSQIEQQYETPGKGGKS